MANGNGSTLLAGTPNFVWETSPEGEITGVAADSIFGAVIGPDGSARLVPAPIDPALIQGIRAAARPDGGWDVLFAEVSPPPASSSAAAHLWYGVLRGDGWAPLERLPAPDSALPHPVFTSSLVRHGDTLSWATVPAGVQSHRAISLFQRVEGRWMHESVPVAHAADVELAYADTSGLFLVAVQPDPTMRDDISSLLLWERRPDWRRVRRLVHGGGEGPVNHPSLVRAGRDFLVTWWTPAGEGGGSRLELRARYIRPDATEPPAFVVDSNFDMWSEAVPVVAGDGVPVWAVHQGQPGGEAAGTRELRYVGAAGEHAFELARSPSPYVMRVASVQPRSGEMLMSGMEYVENRFAFSLLLTLNLQCPLR